MNNTIEKPERSTSAWRAFFQRIDIKLAIKTGVAAGLSLFVGLSFSKLFNRSEILVSGLWCVMASIVVLQANLGGTYKAAWQRFLGVLIGSVMGGFFTSIIEKTAMVEESIINLSLAIFFTMIICSILNIKDSFRIASMSTAIVVILAGLHPGTNPWSFSFYRFIDSCIGIVVGVTVAYVLWPEKATENLKHSLAKATALINKCYHLSTDLQTESKTQEEAVDELFQEIETLLFDSRNILDESKLEHSSHSSDPNTWAVSVNHLENMFEAVMTLRHARKDTLEKILDDSLAHHVAMVIGNTDLCFQDIEKMFESQKSSSHFPVLKESLEALNQEMLRFRMTRTTRKFSLEDVESFYVFFYSLRLIGEELIKLEHNLANV